MPNICEFCELGTYGDFIGESDYWTIFLAPSQRYLGTCVVVLKRECNDLMELNTEEWVDFGGLVSKLELALKKIFNPALYNWSCFKNAAFRSSPSNPQIHWHFIPRYNGKVEFMGLTFEDPDFGYIPQPVTRIIPDKIRSELLNLIKVNLSL
ncbi:MAG: HIT domain-containing protein [Methanobacterium sp. BRmetb2]|jgi:diadenosine tetraphosphate (Ap4A) HIT family hydrolase|nr:MAG: HIT domain-containing protein [Methanobacterium sp. BRmetb2]